MANGIALDPAVPGLAPGASMSLRSPGGLANEMASDPPSPGLRPGLLWGRGSQSCPARAAIQAPGASRGTAKWRTNWTGARPKRKANAGRPGQRDGQRPAVPGLAPGASMWESPRARARGFYSSRKWPQAPVVRDARHAHGKTRGYCETLLLPSVEPPIGAPSGRGRPAVGTPSRWSSARTSR